MQDAAAVEKEEKKDETLESQEEEEEEKRRKLFVVNLPWSFSAPDIEKLFGECGTVKDVEVTAYHLSCFIFLGDKKKRCNFYGDLCLIFGSIADN